jgi:PKD repeat protein
VKFLLETRRIFFTLLALALITTLLSGGANAILCDAKNTPIIKSDKNSFILYEGKAFYYDFNLSNLRENEVTYTYSFLEGKVTGLSINENGVLSLLPGRDDSGQTLVALLSFKQGCLDTLVINLTIYSKPVINEYYPPESEFGLNASQPVNFSVKVSSDNPNDTLKYEWYFDGQHQNISPQYSNIRIPGQNITAGIHNVTFIATNSYGLNSSSKWTFIVAKVNKAPALIAEIPGFITFKNVNAEAYDLNNYFVDPERGKLKFSVRQVLPTSAKTLNSLRPANATANITTTGFVSYLPQTDNIGYAHFIFTATDIQGLSTDSNIVRLDVLNAFLSTFRNSTQISLFCGDFSCNSLENCTTCQHDCGVCENADFTGCLPKWECTDWSACTPFGLQTRECIDINLCEDNRTIPDTGKFCIYDASCSDNLKNGIEEGIDCGGICGPCSNCTDNLLNQGEEQVDCGGPCNACPSCSDGIKNSNETDIDCGGGCLPCTGGLSCKINRDCDSLTCRFLKCDVASCVDGIKNQDEESIDCGGTCPNVCHSCSDGIMNGNEKGLDCGGICGPCGSCSDGIKNQDEDLTDCGGFSCKTCTLNNYINDFFYGMIIVGVMSILIVAGITTYLFTIPYRPEQAEKMFENSKNFSLLLALHHGFRWLRIILQRKAVLNNETHSQIISRINSLLKKDQYSNKEVHDVIYYAYSQALDLPEQFDYKMLARKVHQLKVSHFMKIMIVGYFKKSEILITGSFVPTEIKDQLVAELKFILTELTQP